MDTKHLVFWLILRWAGNSPRAYAPTQCSCMDTRHLVSMISGQQSPQSWYMLHTYPNAKKCASPYSVIPATANPSTLFFLSQNSKHQCIMVPESHNNANLSHNVSHLTFLPVQYCTGWISCSLPCPEPNNLPRADRNTKLTSHAAQAIKFGLFNSLLLPNFSVLNNFSFVFTAGAPPVPAPVTVPAFLLAVATAFLLCPGLCSGTMIGPQLVIE